MCSRIYAFGAAASRGRLISLNKCEDSFASAMTGLHLSPCGRGIGRPSAAVLDKRTPKRRFGYVASEMRSG